MYARHRFPAEIISYAVWLYYAFPLSYRDVEKLLLYRGIEVSQEAVRAWCNKFGQQYANAIRSRRPRPGDKWHLDEMVVSINAEQYYLWRAVDQDGNVLDMLMQKRRDKVAAKREILPNVEHRQHKGLNNRAENSHQATRTQERRMRRFKSAGHAQRFCSSFELIRQHFHPKQHKLPATEYRQQMRQRFESWCELTSTQIAA